jgi:predicted enzyme related to lactoylglutathione lyase
MARLLINIDVDDLERGIAFYTAAFGLRVGRRFGRGFVELLGGEAPIYLLTKEAGSLPFHEALNGRRYDRHWTPVHLDFVVDDLNGAVVRAVEAGASLSSLPSEAPYGRLALLSDPFGHGFCLLEFRGKGYDELPRTDG